jgi:hypothetical protein
MPEVLPETEYDRMRKGYLAGFVACIDRAKDYVGNEKWQDAMEELQDAVKFLKLLKVGEDNEQE